jgi:hypothetical protein
MLPFKLSARVRAGWRLQPVSGPGYFVARIPLTDAGVCLRIVFSAVHTSVLLFPAMKTLIMLCLAAALAATACRANKNSYTSSAGGLTPSELVSNTVARVPIATRNLSPGTILRASDISFVQIAESDAPPNVPKVGDLVGHKNRVPISKGQFILSSQVGQ